MTTPHAFAYVAPRLAAPRVRYQRQWHAEWGHFRYEPGELRDLGDRFLVIGRIRSDGLNSGATLDSDYADLFTLSAGRVIREQTYFNRAEALQAAGLRDQDRFRLPS